MSSATASPSRGGRPRDPQIDAAVLEATLAVLGEGTYAQLSLEQIARRAETTKPAIYRRWPGKQHLVLSALATRLADAVTPDTGCTMCDLNEGIDVFVQGFRRIRPEVLSSLLADCTADPVLHEKFMRTLFDPPRAAVATMLDRAIARGDLRDDVDRDLVLDLLGSLVHYRALFGHATTDGRDVERAVEALLGGIATDYEALLVHSREVNSTSPTHPAHRV